MLKLMPGVREDPNVFLVHAFCQIIVVLEWKLGVKIRCEEINGDQ